MDQTQFEVPDEFRHLGEFRLVFAATAGAMARSVVRSVIPLGVGCGLFALAALWIVDRNWKYYLVLLIGTLFTLQGVRVLLRTLRRWNQKVLIFEKGIAISRYRELATYTWDRIEQVEAVVAQAQGAPSSFLSFSFQGRSKTGETRPYNFHPAGDPIPNLKGLWKIIDEEVGHARAASAIAAVKSGEEVTFQRTIWGTIVSTQIGISDFGVRVKPRYDEARFADWSRIQEISVVDQPTVSREQGYTTGGIPHLEITEKSHSTDPWVSELTSDIPGYQALIEAAQFARLQYVETIEELHRDKLPAALAVIAEGQEFALGKFGISRSGFRYEAESILWPDLGFLNFEKELLAAPEMGDRTFAYDSLTLADRCLLQLVAQSARYDHDYPDGEGEEIDEKLKEESE